MLLIAYLGTLLASTDLKCARADQCKPNPLPNKVSDIISARGSLGPSSTLTFFFAGNFGALTAPLQHHHRIQWSNVAQTQSHTLRL